MFIIKEKIISGDMASTFFMPSIQLYFKYISNT